jgi:hypothetical protein
LIEFRELGILDKEEVMRGMEDERIIRLIIMKLGWMRFGVIFFG